METAQRLLGRDVLQTFVQRRQLNEIWQRSLQVMQYTDLIAPQQL